MRTFKVLLTMAAFACVSLAAAAQSQQQAPPSKPPEQKEQAKAPAKKAKKVWGEDDVKDLRKPWDEHTDAQRTAAEAKAAADAKAAEDAKAAANAPAQEKSTNPIDPKTGKPIVDPDSVEGLEEQLKNWQLSLKNTETELEAARKRMAELTGNPERWESAKLEVEILEGNIQDTKKRIAELEPRIEQAKKPGAKPAAPPAPEKP